MKIAPDGAFEVSVECPARELTHTMPGLGALPRKPVGLSLWVGDRPREIVLFVPPGAVELRAETMRSWLYPDATGADRNLGATIFVAKPDVIERVTFTVDPVADPVSGK